MAKFPLPLDTFPPLALALEDKQALEAAADEVVKCTIEQYHAHLTVHNSVVDPRRWKKIKQREDVSVYHERSTYRIRDTTSSEPVSDFTIMAPMFTFGSIQGSLDDVLYGALNPSLRDMRLKSAYVEDGFVDWGLLAPIITPSEDDPFRELSIKWTVKAHPMLIATVLRMRDALYLESIGTAMTPSGERIGYHLQHSVDVPGVHELTDHQVVRAKVSFCHIFRQRKPNCVEVFVRGVISPMGSASGFITAVSIAEISVSVFRNTHCAEMKTLSRLITAQQQQHHHRTHAILLSSSSSSSSGASTDSSYSSSIAAGAACSQCDTSMRNDSRRLFGTAGAPKDKRCRLCSAHVCSRCRVLKTVHLPSPYDPKELVSATVACCTRCLLRIASVPNLSATVAALDARAAAGKDVDYIAALLPSIGASLSS